MLFDANSLRVDALCCYEFVSAGASFIFLCGLPINSLVRIWNLVSFSLDARRAEWQFLRSVYSTNDFYLTNNPHGYHCFRL